MMILKCPGTSHPEKRKLYDFIAAQRFAVVATISASGVPEAALVGIAVTPDLELISKPPTPPANTATFSGSALSLVIGIGRPAYFAI